MASDAAETGALQSLLAQVGAGLDAYLRFEHEDAQHPDQRWQTQLNRALPREGIISRVPWTRVNGHLALRPCFIGARSELCHARDLVGDVLRIAGELSTS